MKHAIIGILIFALLVFAVTAGIVFWVVGYMPYIAFTTMFRRDKRKPNYRWMFDLAKNQFKKNEVKN